MDFNREKFNQLVKQCGLAVAVVAFEKQLPDEYFQSLDFNTAVEICEYRGNLPTSRSYRLSFNRLRALAKSFDELIKAEKLATDDQTKEKLQLELIATANNLTELQHAHCRVQDNSQKRELIAQKILALPSQKLSFEKLMDIHRYMKTDGPEEEAIITRVMRFKATAKEIWHAYFYTDSLKMRASLTIKIAGVTAKAPVWQEISQSLYDNLINRSSVPLLSDSYCQEIRKNEKEHEALQVVLTTKMMETAKTLRQLLSAYEIFSYERWGHPMTQKLVKAIEQINATIEEINQAILSLYADNPLMPILRVRLCVAAA